MRERLDLLPSRDSNRARQGEAQQWLLGLMECLSLAPSREEPIGMSTGLPVNGGSEQKSTETNPEYARYLQSPRWRMLARAVCIRAKGEV